MSLLSRAGQIAGGESLLLKAERTARNFLRGSHGRRAAGPGEAFWQFRPWATGDARRDIDWRRSAKSGNVFVKEREWAAAQSVFLWRDASGSMDFGAKKETAELLLLALAIVLMNGGEKVALLGGGKNGSGGGSIERIAEALPSQGAAAGDVPANAHVVLIGDFYDGVPEFGAAGTIVHLYAPEEETLPYDGRVRFEGMEGEGGLDIAAVESVRAAYIERFAAHRAALADLAKARGWNFESFRTDAPPGHMLSRLIEGLSAHV